MSGSVKNNIALQTELYNPLFTAEWETHALYDLAEWVNGFQKYTLQLVVKKW